MRTYHDRAPYVRARFEPGGEELNGITLNGADMSDMHGYADVWVVPPDQGAFVVPANLVRIGARITTSTVFKVPRIEPHLNPPWLEPPEGFV